MNILELKRKSKEIRREVVSMISKSKGGHIGTSLSEIDILTVLYFHTMHYSEETANSPERDRFILSKGHGSEGLYCTLAEKNIIPMKELDQYLRHDCPLTIHPTRHIPGIEMNTGALGHGFSNAVGIALSAKKNNLSFRTFVLTGDGELQEGSNWEAAMSAAHFKLGNLTIIVDNNGLQLGGSIKDTLKIEPLHKKFEAFGFDVHEVNGNSIEELVNIFDSLDYTSEIPHAVIAHTIKGCGVSFMENIPEWHHRIPTAEEAKRALEELA